MLRWVLEFSGLNLVVSFLIERVSLRIRASPLTGAVSVGR